MPEVRPYYSDKGLTAAFYDLTTALDPTLKGDIDIYLGLTKPGASVLELGAGTGRVSLALAEQGRTVLGLDLAPTMLVQAENRREAASPEVAARMKFVRGDMAALKLGESFDAVICPFFGLAHLPAGAAWRNVFTGVAAHLRPSGMAAFHLPKAERLAEPPPPPDRPVLQHRLDATGRQLSIFIKSRTSKPAVGRFDQVVDHVVTDAAGRIERQARERLTYYAADPTPFALEAGLILDRLPIDLGGVGAVHVFRRD
jgi:SAM-dependent methyltransferase